MREQITWEETKGDSVNGYGIKIHYSYTSFNKKVNHNDWRKVIHRGEKEDTTDLEGKCGSCRHFRPIENMSGFSCYGKCARGCVMGQRTRRACKRYEK